MKKHKKKHNRNHVSKWQPEPKTRAVGGQRARLFHRLFKLMR